MLLRRPTVTFLVVLCLASISTLLADFLRIGGFGFDYRVFRYSAQVDLAEIYAPHPHAPFVYPPTAIAFFRPLGLMPISIGLAVWLAISALLFIIATRHIDRRAVLLVAISPVFLKCLLLGQSALLLASLVLLATTQRGWLCGVLLGVVIAIKPQTAILAPLVLLVRRDWQAIAGMVGAGMAMLVIQLGFFGTQPWLDWWHALPAFRQVLVDEDLLWIMITPAGVAENFGLPPTPFLILGLLLGVSAIIRSARSAEGPELAGLIVTTSVLAVPYAVSHDLIALLPWAALVVWRERLSVRVIGAILVLTMGYMAVGLVIFAALWTLKLSSTSDRHRNLKTSASA